MNRREAREIAVKLVYQFLLVPENPRKQFDLYFNENDDIDIDNEGYEYIQSVVFGVLANRDMIDETIQQNAVGWKLSRMSKIDVAILEVAIFEILKDETIPHKVSINEAVELAKKYSEDKSRSFINGILGSVIN